MQDRSKPSAHGSRLVQGLSLTEIVLSYMDCCNIGQSTWSLRSNTLIQMFSDAEESHARKRQFVLDMT